MPLFDETELAQMKAQRDARLAEANAKAEAERAERERERLQREQELLPFHHAMAYYLEKAIEYTEAAEIVGLKPSNLNEKLFWELPNGWLGKDRKLYYRGTQCISARYSDSSATYIREGVSDNTSVRVEGKVPYLMGCAYVYTEEYVSNGEYGGDYFYTHISPRPEAEMRALVDEGFRALLREKMNS